MPSKRVRLYIDSDTTGVQKGISSTQRQLRGFEQSAKKTQGVMGGLSSTASGLGLAFGAAGLAVGIKTSIDAFKEQEKSTAKVIATLKTLGVNTDAVRKKIADVTTAQSKLSGFQDEELQASFATILRVTKDVNESFKLNSLAMDIARGSGKNLNAVAVAIAKVADGNAGALGRYGIKAQKGATSTDVLAEAQKRYAGQAKEFGDTTAGAAEKANAQINELQESIGAKLAPALNTAAGATIRLSSATGSFIDHAGGIGPLVVGAGGFGAFKLLAPSIGNASSALGALGKVAGKQGAGSSFRVLGSAIGASISPMTAAAVGAGLLAGGVYELWHNSENADQAVKGLNDTIKSLDSALGQQTTARDAVKSARDYVNATKDAEAAARSRASALHADITALREHKGSESQVEAATKKWKKALDDVVPAVHARQRATHELDSAQRNLRASTDGVNSAADKQSAKSTDVTNKITDQAKHAAALSRNLRQVGDGNDSAADKAAAAGEVGRRSAAIWAAAFDKAAAATKRTDSAVSKVDSNLAGFARRVGRIPSAKEIKLITNFTAQGSNLDSIMRKLAAIHDKKVSVQFNQTFGARVNPLTGLPKRATGGMIPGRYSDGDRVPAMLSGGEAVLNPKQISMVDAGMTVMGALDATGAPTSGFGFAPGKKPSKPQVGGGRVFVSGKAKTPPTKAELVAAALDRRNNQWGLAQAKAALRIAQADSAGDPTGNALAYEADAANETTMIRAIQQILANPAKALGVKGATLNRQQRTALLQALASAISQRTSDLKTAFDLRHPEATDAESAAAATGEGSGAGDTGPTPDQQAALDQKQRQIDVLTRSGALSEAAVRAFGSSGDIGTGGFANAFAAAGGGPQIAILGDARSLQAFGAASTAGMGLQPSISANAASVNV